MTYTRTTHPRFCFVIEHLPNLVLFFVTTPVALAALILHLT